MYIGGEEKKNILRFVDFLKLCNVTNQFTYLTIDILTNGITLPLSYR